MAINRFYQPPQLDLSFRVHTPIEWQPNMELWGKVFSQKQQELNAIRDLRDPNHIDESALAVKTQMDKIRNQRDIIIDTYKNGDLNKGLQLQNELVGNVMRAVQPGGWFANEEQLYNKYVKTVEDRKKLVEEDPVYWQRAGLNAIKTKGSYIDKNGKYVVGSVNAGVWGKYQDIPQDLIDKLKDWKPDGRQVYDQSPDGSIIYYGKQEKVPFDEVYNAAMQMLNNPQYQHQLMVDAQQLGLDQKWVDDNTAKKIDALKAQVGTKKGIKQLQLNLKAVGLYDGPINGIMDSKEVTTKLGELEKLLLARDPNAIALELVKDNIVRPIADRLSYTTTDMRAIRNPMWDLLYGKYKDNNPFSNYGSTSNSIIDTNNTGMANSFSDLLGNFSTVSDDGKLASAKKLRTHYGGSYNFTVDTTLNKSDKDFLTYLNDPKLEEKNPALYAFYNENAGGGLTHAEIIKQKGYNSKQAHNYLKVKFDEKRKMLATRSNVILEFTHEMSNNMTEAFLGEVTGTNENKKPRVGKIANRKIFASINLGDPIEEYSFKQFIERAYGEYNDENVANFIQSGYVLGTVRPDNPNAASLLEIQYVDAKGNPAAIRVKDSQGDQNPYNLELHNLSTVLFNGGQNRSAIVTSSLPGFQGRGIYAQAKDVYTLDLLKKQIEPYERRIAGGEKLKGQDLKEYNDLKDQIKIVNNDPYKNHIKSRIGFLYFSNGEPVMFEGEDEPLTLDEYREMWIEATGMEQFWGASTFGRQTPPQI